MKAQRIDRVTAPLVAGTFYLVPTVRVQWGSWIGDWPVIGPEHDDAEFFEFRTRHYHVDARFVRKWPLYSRYGDQIDTLGWPLHARPGQTLPSPIWRRRKCQRVDAVGTGWYGRPGTALAELKAHFADQPCLRGKGGWICPHRKASLGSVLPIDGVITCPLHGLRINAKTGRVLPTEERES